VISDWLAAISGSLGQRPPTPSDCHRLGQNGDRWTITAVSSNGGLTVRHRRSHRTVQLPADYVHISTGLGYDTTIHGAQGVTADTMHGLLTGQESRQQLYTMLTSGRHANHLYLQVVGDGDPHTLIRPDTVTPRTPTETLPAVRAASAETPGRAPCSSWPGSSSLPDWARSRRAGVPR
jgi:hypothetical protein